MVLSEITHMGFSYIIVVNFDLMDHVQYHCMGHGHEGSGHREIWICYEEKSVRFACSFADRNPLYSMCGDNA